MKLKITLSFDFQKRRPEVSSSEVERESATDSHIDRDEKPPDAPRIGFGTFDFDPED